MGFWELLEVASAPVIQVLLISALGALMATDYCNNLLSADFRKSLNKIVFIAFTPSLIFASFAKTVSLEDMISWWFMPVNIGFTFLIGGILGWIIVKVLKPNPKVEGLIIASCSTGNMGNLPVVIIPAICDEKGGPFGAPDDCRSRALSYSFFSLALGGVFIWTYTYQLIRNSSMRYKAFEVAENLKIPNKDLGTTEEARLLRENDIQIKLYQTYPRQFVAYKMNLNLQLVDQSQSIVSKNGKESFWRRTMETMRQILTELMSPPTIATILGFLFGGVKWLRNLIIGHDAPLKVVEDSIQLLGDGTIPCITLLLGGNLTQGMQSSSIQPLTLICIIIARLFLLPAIGFFVVKAAANFGFLPLDPLFQYVLVMQYALPPAMNISTMAQLFDVGTEEFSVILLWTYGAATIALTLWSTFLIWIFS
ncbi:protein PIN-LIKES 7-like [Abrus precatorius]|uniref:Protein PIN-LIKES 7-like n=1 Tax=Abrus precatorius TaxID=3816 RepID=A0A8B8KVG5_ABRPR|nr:protein PIN-LIKES 7-like [Abrus precatorius]